MGNGDILIGCDMAEVAERQGHGYITHALCRSGSCRFAIGLEEHTIAAGDCMILPQQSLRLRVLQQSDDLAVEIIYVSHGFVAISTPQSNYGMRGHLALFKDPVMHLSQRQQEVCALNFDYIRRRLALQHHNFYRDAMINAVQCMIIDFFDFHADIYGESTVSGQQAVLMQRFLSMLDHGEFRRHREVGYYADKLCVSPKYLAEICKKTSGEPAIYWITRYTVLDISRHLRNSELTLDEISDLYGFSSLSYFVRYVQKHLGVAPSAIRG